jgi:glycosyltransferase involved in cell wall biosynthesis
MDWLVVTGGAHKQGGQDRANLELIRFLAQPGIRAVHVVAHEVADEVCALPGVRLSLVPRPLGSTVLGERLLERAARTVHAGLKQPSVVLANGGNYSRANASWVHSLHALWPVRDDGAAVPRRMLNRVKKWDARIRERRAFNFVRVLIANSAKTATDLVQFMKFSTEKVITIPFGSDPRPSGGSRQRGALRVAFIGALGWDRNKGLDVALEALRILASAGEQRITLTVAGSGALEPWRRMARQKGVEHQVTFLGAIDDVPGLLREIDLLVSPVRYEAYGLAVQEALVAGVPAIVSGSAGIASTIGATLPELVVADHENPDAWATAISRALTNAPSLGQKVTELGERFARRSWRAMAAELVDEVERRV